LTFDTLPKVKILRAHLNILFENLISNSIKFRRKDKTLKICIETQKVDNYIQFMIADNGVGIEESNHKYVFQLFKRLDRDKFEGTGIGLSMCKKIVEIYNGSIWLETNKSGGCSFYFRILNE